MTDKEQIMDKLYGALAGLFLVYGISTEEGSGKIIIDLLKEVEKQYQSKEQECEELKKRATIAEDNFACEIQARLYHQNEWLKFSKENEELKKSVDKIKNYVKNQMFDVDCENWFDRFIYTFEEWKKSICEDSARYLKALEEIEEVAKDITEKDCYENSDAKASKILDIISKAKEEIVAYRRLTDLRLVKEYCCKPEGIKCPIHNYCYNDEFQCRYWKQIFKRINEEGFVVRQGNHWYKDFRNEEQLLGIISKAKGKE